MTITFDLAENIGCILQAKCDNLPRFALESLALEAYRAEILTAAEVQQQLGYDTPYALDGFLKDHGVFLEYSPEELEREAANSRRLCRQRQKELDDRERRAG